MSITCQQLKCASWSKKKQLTKKSEKSSPVGRILFLIIIFTSISEFLLVISKDLYPLIIAFPVFNVQCTYILSSVRMCVMRTYVIVRIIV